MKKKKLADKELQTLMIIIMRDRRRMRDIASEFDLWDKINPQLKESDRLWDKLYDIRLKEKNNN
jgi:hypothetical protein